MQQKKISWEFPLGTQRQAIEEPGRGFIDPYAAKEREAIQEIERDAQRQHVMKKTKA